MAILGSLEFGARTGFPTTLSTSINLGTNPNRWVCLFTEVIGASSAVLHNGATVGGVAMTYDGSESMNTLLGTPGQFSKFRLDGPTVPTGLQTLNVTRNDPGGWNQTGYVIWGDGQTTISAPGALISSAGATIAASRASAAGQLAVFAAHMEASGAGPVTVTVNAPATSLAGTGSGGAVQRFYGASTPGASTASIAGTIAGSQFTPASIIAAWTLSTTVTPGPVISTHPASQSVAAGGSAAFSVSAAASGGGALSYQWKDDGVNVGTNSPNYNPTVAYTDNGAAITVAVTETGGTNPGTVTSNAATLTVTAVAPTVITSPISQSKIAGDSVTFTAAFSGNPTPTVQWRKNGTNISGATSLSYTYTTVLGDNGAVFTCVASNPGGSATSAGATLTVSAAAVAPTIVTHPQATALYVGGTLSLSVVATGTAPLAYQWRKNGVDIVGANASTLLVAGVQLTDNGASYQAYVSNGTGNALSSAAVLTVTVAPEAPSGAWVQMFGITVPDGFLVVF